MNLRRKGAFAIVLGIIAVLLAAGPAHASDPIPGPVDEIMDIPSRTLKMQATWSDVRAAMVWQAMGQHPGTVATIPKPITPTSVVARGAQLGSTAAGTALVGFQVGWAIGQGGLATYAAATGTSYEGLACGGGDWYNAANDFIMLGMGPNCGGTYAATDPGNVITGGKLTFGNFSASYVGRREFVSGGQPRTTFCFRMSSQSVPAGYVLWPVYPAGAPGSSSAGVTCDPSFGGVHLDYYTDSRMTYTSLAPQLTLRQTSSQGPVVAQTGFPTEKPATQALRTPKCKINWEDGTTTTGTGTPYTQESPLPISSQAMGCYQAYVSKPGAGPDLLPSRITVDEEDESGGIRTISDTEVPDMSPAERKALDPNIGNGRGLVLEKIVGTVATSCMTWAADCTGWWTETNNGTTPGTYRCTYAGEALDLAECGVYRHTFDTRTATPTITDPATGESVEWGAQPNTGNSINPGTAVSPGDACFATGWAAVANPVDWVLVPIKCALVWAFVPRLGTVESTVTALGESAGDVAAVDPFLAMLGTLPAGGGCDGIPISLTFFGETASGRLLYACDGFGATAAAVVNGLLTLAVCTAALVAVVRYAAAVFGFVGPGGGIDQQQYSNVMMARSAARSD